MTKDEQIEKLIEENENLKEKNAQLFEEANRNFSMYYDELEKWSNLVNGLHHLSLCANTDDIYMIKRSIDDLISLYGRLDKSEDE